MAEFVKLSPGALQPLRTITPRLVSYNIEMAEVTGGTFWKAYTPEQVAGSEPFAAVSSIAQLAQIMQVYPPIDLYNPRLRALAKELGPVWVRVSGTWATKTYYDFDGHTGGKVPDGYKNVLTKQQWIGVLDFVKAVGAKLLVSVNNCIGLHTAHEPWNPSQAELLFGLSKEYGVPIDAAEFMNEPHVLENAGAPAGYTAADFTRDQDLFFSWLRANYPEVLCVGPCSGTDGRMGPRTDINGGLGMNNCTTPELMDGAATKLDVFSYHYYNGVSERLSSAMPGMHWQAEEAHTEPYLALAAENTRIYAKFRDRYCPGAPIWVTESGDAGGGGNTWASTYLDVLRTLNELAEFATITDGAIFHNTMASSAYGYLQHGSFEPRPNYFAVLLWNRLMGTTVYNTAEPIREGAHVYAHSRKDGQPGAVYLIINNSLTDPTTVELPTAAQRYTLTGDGKVRSLRMLLNGQPLALGENDALPPLEPAAQPAGRFDLPPASCTFLVV